MKVNVSKQLKSRLVNAAMNGSIIAYDILEQINKNVDMSEIVRGTANFFGTKRKRSVVEGVTKVKIVFTTCNKDITNENFPDRNNPQAPWFHENRTELDPSTFVKNFIHLPEYTSADMEYFANALSVDSLVTIKLYSKMDDFVFAYSGENYSDIAQWGDSTLHNSCMRHENTTRNAADFYYNFAGAKIIIATDAANNVLGRAIVWTNSITAIDGNPVMLSVVDRVYYTHSFVYKMILRYAKESGIKLRKKYNDFSHPTEFIVLNPVTGLDAEEDNSVYLKLNVVVPASKWHKQGVPYMDTFSYIQVEHGEGGTYLKLANYQTSDTIASCRSTTGFADACRTLCPVCGKIHQGKCLCDDCYNEMFKDTVIGRVLVGKVKKYNNKVYPASLIHKGRPTPLMALSLQIDKFYEQ